MATRKMKRIGSKAEVYHGTADHTSGGLKKHQLVKNKHGRIVSRKQQASGRKAIKRLFKMGYKPKKGTFKAFKKGMRSTRRRGGNVPEPGSGSYGGNVSANSAAALQTAMKALSGSS